MPSKIKRNNIYSAYFIDFISFQLWLCQLEILAIKRILKN